MSSPTLKTLALAINKNGNQKIYFALEGAGIDLATCTLKVGRTGEPLDWECKILKNDSLATKLVGSFKYKGKVETGEKKNDDKGTEELEFVVTNPGSPPATLRVTVTVVVDTR